MNVIRFWALPHRGTETAALLKSHLRDFQRRHPGVQVEVLVRSRASIWKYLTGMLKRPEPLPPRASHPQLIEIPSYWTATLAHLGLAQNLSEMGTHSLEEWLPQVRPHCASSPADADRAGIYSLPWWMEIGVLYHRGSADGRAGIDPEAPLDSWKSLEDFCRNLSRRGGRARGASAVASVIGRENPRRPISLTDVAARVWSDGGNFFAEGGSRSLLHRTELVSSLHAYLGLAVRGWMPLMDPDVVSEGRRASAPIFQFSGRVPRERPVARLRGVRAVPCLRGAAGRCGLLNAHHLVLLKEGPPTAEAYRLLCRLASDGEARRYARSLGAFSCRPGWDDGDWEGRPELRDVFREAFAQARLIPNLPVMATLEQVFDRGMKRVALAIGRGDYSEAILQREMLCSAAEMDYILSSYA
ncbi:MAG: hypothetical protein HY551_07705 [Elusimicrobia bacterium]|nr:hypothetical protein [Elusimicrobiota bacterium]